MTLKVMNTLDRAKERSSQDSRFVLSMWLVFHPNFITLVSSRRVWLWKEFHITSSCQLCLAVGMDSLVHSSKYSSTLQAFYRCSWFIHPCAAIPFLNSTTPYQYDPRTRTYQQPVASQQVLRRFLLVNRNALQSLKIKQPINIEKLSRFQVGTSLSQLIEAGKNDAHISSDVLSVTLEQLEHQTECDLFPPVYPSELNCLFRYPVLLAVDDFQALYRTSQYRDSDYNRIQSFHLSIPRLLLEYAGGFKPFVSKYSQRRMDRFILYL